MKNIFKQFPSLVWAVVTGVVLGSAAAAFTIPLAHQKPRLDQPNSVGLAFSTPRTPAEKSLQAVWLVKASDTYGSAVAVRYKGDTFLLTAKHVVVSAGMVELLRPARGSNFRDGTVSLKARVTRVSKTYDLAVLRLDNPPTGLFDAAVALHSANYPAVGTETFLAGNIFGPRYPLSISRGIVAAHGVQPENWLWETSLDQTDATGYPGVSGGAVFIDGNLAGIVVGMGAPNVLFYVPARDIRTFLNVL